MTLGASLDDLGLGFPARATPAEPTPSEPDPAALVPGSPLARVLFEVWSGRPIVVVDSPPGAGKTTLVTDVVAQLSRRADMNVVVATPTRRAAIDLAERLGSVLGVTPDGTARVVFGPALKPYEEVSERVATAHTGQKVVVRTLASTLMSAPQCDLLVVDEAYQSVFADVALAGERSAQVLLVGDPGQIGPVEQSDTSVWSGRRLAPHLRTPEVFGQADDAFDIRLPSTYRIGPDAARAIAPLYDFPFDSRRPDRWTERHGRHLPEITATQVPAAGSDGEFDLAVLGRLAHLATGYIGDTRHETVPDGPVAAHTIGEDDIAVVVARSGQEAAVRALLKRSGITVGTADRLQGGQWPVVVALDPLVGAADADDFRTGPGRLCVMASRHTTHLHWVHDGRWASMLDAAAVDGRRAEDARKGVAVRRALCE
ncbi:AAA family ATPase [Myceligenerans halotolerans]